MIEYSSSVLLLLLLNYTTSTLGLPTIACSFFTVKDKMINLILCRFTPSHSAVLLGRTWWARQVQPIDRKLYYHQATGRCKAPPYCSQACQRHTEDRPPSAPGSAWCCHFRFCDATHCHHAGDAFMLPTLPWEHKGKLALHSMKNKKHEICT